jgi:hypothetical protein
MATFLFQLQKYVSKVLTIILRNLLRDDCSSSARKFIPILNVVTS